MQIIIVQSEIELAIQNYIKSQINLREGQNISVDLTATRGEAGFKAVIDITSNTVTTHPVADIQIVPLKQQGIVKHIDTPVELLNQPKTATEMRQALEAQYAAEEQAKVVTETKVEDTTTVEATATEATAEQAATAEAVEAIPEPIAETAKIRGIFGNLRKPVNIVTTPAGS